MKVVIVGAGIGGLSAAIAFKRQGHTVVIYDRCPEMLPIGAAISVWSNGVKVLNSFGLGKQIAAAGGTMDRMAYRKFDDASTYCEFSLDKLYRNVKQRAYPISRTDLQNILLDAAGRENVHLNKNVIDFESSPAGVTIHFEDGSSDSGDFAILADGTHSKMRNKVCGKLIERRYAGYVNMNGTVPTEALRDYVDDTTWTQYVGEGKRVSMMPMGNGLFYFFFDSSPDRSILHNTTTYKSELTETFKGWHAGVQKLIEAINPSKVARVEIHDTDPLPTLVDPLGRAVLLGDAAHATTPDLGQGGCQAMEDAFVIAQLFEKNGVKSCDTGSSISTETLQTIVAQYQAERAERVASLVLRARKRADTTHGLEGMEVTEQWYKELEGEDGTHIMDGMSKTILGAPTELDRWNGPTEEVHSDGKKELLTEVSASSY